VGTLPSLSGSQGLDGGATAPPLIVGIEPAPRRNGCHGNCLSDMRIVPTAAIKAPHLAHKLRRLVVAEIIGARSGPRRKVGPGARSGEEDGSTGPATARSSRAGLGLWGVGKSMGVIPYLYAFYVYNVKLESVRNLRYICSMADIPVMERLKALRMRAGVSMAEAAAACGYKTASGYQHYEDPKFTRPYLPREILEKLVPLFTGRAGKGEVPVTAAEVWALAGGPPKGDPVVIMDPEPLRLRASLVPIYSAAQGGKGHIIIDFDPIEEARPPDELSRVRDAYGILIVGESMVPAYKPGDVAWVNPHKPVERDTDVVLYHVPPHGEAEAIIKTLVSFSPREWKLRQYQPLRDFTESRVDWPVCHRIVGKRNVR
jgi:hypothetical protein